MTLPSCVDRSDLVLADEAFNAIDDLFAFVEPPKVRSVVDRVEEPRAEKSLCKEDDSTKRICTVINGMKYELRIHANLQSFNVVFHILKREGTPGSFYEVGAHDIQFRVEYKDHVYETSVNQYGVMRDLKWNAIAVSVDSEGYKQTLARHGLPTIPENLVIEQGLKKIKNDDLIVGNCDASQTIHVIERTALSLVASGEKRLSLPREMRGNELSKLRTPDFMRCSQMILTIPYDDDDDWLRSLLSYCYPLLKVLRLNRDGLLREVMCSE